MSSDHRFYLYYTPCKNPVKFIPKIYCIMKNSVTINVDDWTHWGQRTRVSPFPTIISMETMCKELSEYAFTTLNRMIVVFDHGVVHYLLYQNDRARCAQEILEHLQSDPLLYRRLGELGQSMGKHLVSVARDSSDRVSPSVSNQTLLELYQEYEYAYRPVYASYGSVWLVEDALRESILASVRKSISVEHHAIEAVNRLTMEPSTHVATMEEEALIRLALTISETPLWRKQFPAVHIDDLSVEIQERIQQHLHRFYWVSRDYEDPVMTQRTALERLNAALQDNPRLKHQEMADKKTSWQSQSKQTLAMLGLSPSDMMIVEAMRDIAQLKAQRKQYVSKSLFWFDAVLHEIARRLNTTVAHVRFLLRTDIERGLTEGIDPRELQARYDQCAWHVDSSGATLLTDEHRESIRTIITPNSITNDSIRGLGVSPGRARGKVRIILSMDELPMIQPGDVVVSIQLQPNVGTVLYQAAALVCDGGHGITSHPATLAREAGIPAVIQTRNARYLLKDGDMVEVDGYAGTVTRLTHE